MNTDALLSAITSQAIADALARPVGAAANPALPVARLARRSRP
jgi:hypothetical protein